jgi:Tol biopolymer transport system component
VTAPVLVEGAWTLAEDGQLIWDRRFVQLWHHLYAPDGSKIAAVVAPEFGRWTVAVDGAPWGRTFGDYVTDATFSPDGGRIACIGVEQGKATVAVDGAPWPVSFDRAWPPVFSPDGRHVAVKTETAGKYHLHVDGRRHAQTYLDMADPVFSPDGEKILVRAVKTDAAGDAVCVRTVVNVKDLI